MDRNLSVFQKVAVTPGSCRPVCRLVNVSPPSQTNQRPLEWINCCRFIIIQYVLYLNNLVPRASGAVFTLLLRIVVNRQKQQILELACLELEKKNNFVKD